MGDPNSWLVYFMENPIKIDDLEVPPFQETLIYIYIYIYIYILLDLFHVCNAAWMTRTNHRSVMQELHRLLHNICRWTPLQVAQLPGEKERICCAPPFNMAAEPKWATHGTIAVLVVALLILLPKMTTGNHHHQFDGHGIALDYVDLASPYVMDEPNSASETSQQERPEMGS